MKLSDFPQIDPSKPQIAAFETSPEPTKLLLTKSAQDILYTCDRWDLEDPEMLIRQED